MIPGSVFFVLGFVLFLAHRLGVTASKEKHLCNICIVVRQATLIFSHITNSSRFFFLHVLLLCVRVAHAMLTSARPVFVKSQRSSEMQLRDAAKWSRPPPNQRNAAHHPRGIADVQ